MAFEALSILQPWMRLQALSHLPLPSQYQPEHYLDHIKLRCMKLMTNGSIAQRVEQKVRAGMGEGRGGPSLEIVEARDGASQESASQWAVGHNANAQLSAGGDH